MNPGIQSQHRYEQQHNELKHFRAVNVNIMQLKFLTQVTHLERRMTLSVYPKSVRSAIHMNVNRINVST